MKHSNIVLEEFNCCPGTDHFMKVANDWGVKINPVDSEQDYWKNESDTAVFAVSSEMNFSEMLNFTMFINRLRPDELDVETDAEGDAIFRLWWD